MTFYKHSPSRDAEPIVAALAVGMDSRADSRQVTWLEIVDASRIRWRSECEKLPVVEESLLVCKTVSATAVMRHREPAPIRLAKARRNRHPGDA